MRIRLELNVSNEEKCLQRRPESLSKDGELQTEFGKWFHVAGPAMMNPRPPNFVLVR